MTQAYSIRGGHEAHVLHLSTELRRHGFDTRVLVLEELPREEHLFMRLLRERGIPLDAVRRTRAAWVGWAFALVAPVWGAWMLLRGHRPLWGRLRNYIADRPATWVLRNMLRREQPAVIHIMGCLAPYAWPLLPAERCVLHHGTEGRRDDTWEAGDFDAFRAFASRAARNFAPGSGVVANLRREFGIERPIESIFTICPDQADVPPSSPAPAVSASAPLRFGLLSRMTPEKGIHVLLQALHDYQARHGSVDFVFAGGGALEGVVRDFVATHALRGVRVQPAFESPVEILRTLDVFVHPSLSDAMPLAIAEALMCGRPCIVTRVGGIPDLVRDGQEGLLIDPDDPAPIVAAMERFQAMTSEERAAYGRRARARYDDVCRPERVGTVVAAHYRALMAEMPTGA